MGVRLSIEVSSPMSEEDRELMAGVAAMCVRVLGHSGRHKYRLISITRTMDGPLN